MGFYQAQKIEKLEARIAELQQQVCSLIRRDPDDDKDARIAALEAERERLASKFDSKPSMLWSGEAVAYEIRAARAAMEDK